MVAEFFSRHEIDIATDLLKLLSKEHGQLVRELLIEARRFHRYHLLEELKSGGQLLLGVYEEILHGQTA